MSSLFTYIVPCDSGAAPNPFHGMCSLAICKPGIRRAAQEGDWIAGLGSRNAPGGDLSGHLVYAMRVERVLSLEEYDREASIHWPRRIPDIKSMTLSERLGDCIYSFDEGVPTQRPGVHKSCNIKADLFGKNVLLSWDYYYFGSSARKIPDHLLPICNQGLGRRGGSHTPFLEQFVSWVRSLAPEPGQYGWPGTIVRWEDVATCGGCSPRVGALL
ncbi:MAG: hypothetical protein FWD51_00650 [Betaproteobacteria bacterium]|nr:hypothetical protein [Betaproteobacteria bacterium]